MYVHIHWADIIFLNVLDSYIIQIFIIRDVIKEIIGGSAPFHILL